MNIAVCHDMKWDCPNLKKCNASLTRNRKKYHRMSKKREIFNSFQTFYSFLQKQNMANIIHLFFYVNGIVYI